MQGFSSGLYSFFRDGNGQPRGRENTITNVTYTDWLTRTGNITRRVDVLMTPTILVCIHVYGFVCFYCNNCSVARAVYRECLLVFKTMVKALITKVEAVNLQNVNKARPPSAMCLQPTNLAMDPCMYCYTPYRKQLKEAEIMY